MTFAGVTGAQKKWLLRADETGLLSCRGYSGLVRANWYVMMAKLENMGLVRPYPHGGFKLTETGTSYVIDGLHIIECQCGAMWNGTEESHHIRVEELEAVLDALDRLAEPSEYNL